MENHPIPRDITGFQFKLIGSMTVRQFVYLAVGAIFAWFFFFVLPLPFIIKAVLSIIFLGIGAAFAFIPVDGRPMDTMFLNLIKSIFTPSEYIYQKQGGNFSDFQNQNQAVSSDNQAQPVSSSQAIPQPQPDSDSPPEPAPPVLITPPPVIIEPEPVPEQTVEVPDEPGEDKFGFTVEEKTENPPRQIQEIQVSESAPQAETDNNPQQKSEDILKLLEETKRQKEELEKEIEALKANLEKKEPQSAPAPPPKPQIPPKPKATGGSDAPNLIMGTIKDPRGNPLQNILVEVKDQEDNPVRAFKTNPEGKFASATSLSNGKYIISFEDPKEQNKFDEVTIEANGNSLPPFEIISIDKREELRRELFN